MTNPTRSALQLLLVWAVAGALLVQPFALIVMIGAEHGGRGFATVPWAAVRGAALGIALGLVFLAVRYVFRRMRSRAA
jgi:hypothetical protein